MRDKRASQIKTLEGYTNAFVNSNSRNIKALLLPQFFKPAFQDEGHYGFKFLFMDSMLTRHNSKRFSDVWMKLW